MKAVRALDWTLTTSERESAGKAARRRAPRSIQGRWEPGPDRPDPVEILEEQDRNRVPELIAIRHGRMLVSAVHLLSRGGGDHGGGPRRDPAVWPRCPALRRRPSLQLRRLRCSGPAADLRHQRLRRDPPRTVRMGREAACRELRGRRPRSRFQEAGEPRGGDHGGPGIPGGDEAAGRRAQHRRLVRASRYRGHRAVPLAGEPQGRPQLRQGEGQGREQEQPARIHQAHP